MSNVESNRVQKIFVHYDDTVHGLSIDMEKGPRKTFGMHLGNFIKLEFSEKNQPIGLYGVMDYKGLIQGLSVYSNVCNLNQVGQVVLLETGDVLETEENHSS